MLQEALEYRKNDFKKRNPYASNESVFYNWMECVINSAECRIEKYFVNNKKEITNSINNAIIFNVLKYSSQHRQSAQSKLNIAQNEICGALTTVEELQQEVDTLSEKNTA